MMNGWKTSPAVAKSVRSWRHSSSLDRALTVVRRIVRWVGRSTRLADCPHRWRCRRTDDNHLVGKHGTSYSIVRVRWRIVGRICMAMWTDPANVCNQWRSNGTFVFVPSSKWHFDSWNSFENRNVRQMDRRSILPVAWLDRSNGRWSASFVFHRRDNRCCRIVGRCAVESPSWWSIAKHPDCDRSERNRRDRFHQDMAPDLLACTSLGCGRRSCRHIRMFGWVADRHPHIHSKRCNNGAWEIYPLVCRWSSGRDFQSISTCCCVSSVPVLERVMNRSSLDCSRFLGCSSRQHGSLPYSFELDIQRIRCWTEERCQCELVEPMFVCRKRNQSIGFGLEEEYKDRFEGERAWIRTWPIALLRLLIPPEIIGCIGRARTTEIASSATDTTVENVAITAGKEDTICLSDTADLGIHVETS